FTLTTPRPPSTTIFPYTTLFRSNKVNNLVVTGTELVPETFVKGSSRIYKFDEVDEVMSQRQDIEATIKEENPLIESVVFNRPDRSEEHTSELQSRFDLVCRLLLE